MTKRKTLTPRPAPEPLKLPPTKEELRVKAVGMVLSHEVVTGHMSPTLAKWLLQRMDEAYHMLLSAAYPEPKPANDNGDTHSG